MEEHGEELLVVAAPIPESEPASPLPDMMHGYQHPYAEDAEDAEGESDSSPAENLSAEDSGETPPAVSPEGNQHSSGTSSEPKDEDGNDDEYTAWMENMGDDGPPPGHVTGEGLSH